MVSLQSEVKKSTRLCAARGWRVSTSAVLTIVFAGLLAFSASHSLAEEILYEQDIQLGASAIPIRAMVGGKKILLGLDTGATDLVLDTSLRPTAAHRAKQIVVNTFGHEMVAEQIEGPPIRVGKWALSTSEILVADCLQFRKFTGISYHGYLGMSALGGAAVDVNFDRRHLRFIKDLRPPRGATLYAPANESGDIWYLPLTFGADGLCPRLNVRINNTVIKMLLDTGSSGGIGLRHGTFEKFVTAGLIEKYPDLVPATVGAGTISSQAGVFTGSDLLGLPLKGWPVRDVGNDDSVGMLFLMNLNFTIDARGERFYFTWRKSGPINAYQRLGLGFRYDESGCYVGHVYAGTEAAKPPAMLEGDSIIKLGPLRTADINVFSVYEMCRQHIGQTIEVEFARSGQKNSLKKTLAIGYPSQSEKHPVFSVSPPQP